MHKTTRLDITDINQHLICVLCSGYLIDATTIIECLHSFCRSCIVRYLETSKYCPICDVQIHKTKPLLNIRLDRTLQDIVYKLVPGLFKDEMKRRRDFYLDHPKAAKKLPYKEDRGEVDELHKIYTTDEKLSVCLQHCVRLPPYHNGSSFNSQPGNKEEKGGDRRYLLCPAAMTVGMVKKFIRLKFELEGKYQIEVFHSDESLKDDYTLMDAAYIYGWRRMEPLKLYYIVFDRTQVSLELPGMESDSSLNTNSQRGRKKRGRKLKKSSSMDTEDTTSETSDRVSNCDSNKENTDIADLANVISELSNINDSPSNVKSNVNDTSNVNSNHSAAAFKHLNNEKSLDSDSNTNSSDKTKIESLFSENSKPTDDSINTGSLSLQTKQIGDSLSKNGANSSVNSSSNTCSDDDEDIPLAELKAKLLSQKSSTASDKKTGTNLNNSQEMDNNAMETDTCLINSSSQPNDSLECNDRSNPHLVSSSEKTVSSYSEHSQTKTSSSPFKHINGNGVTKDTGDDITHSDDVTDDSDAEASDSLGVSDGQTAVNNGANSNIHESFYKSASEDLIDNSKVKDTRLPPELGTSLLHTQLITTSSVSPFDCVHNDSTDSKSGLPSHYIDPKTNNMISSKIPPSMLNKFTLPNYKKPESKNNNSKNVVCRNTMDSDSKTDIEPKQPEANPDFKAAFNNGGAVFPTPVSVYATNLHKSPTKDNNSSSTSSNNVIPLYSSPMAHSLHSIKTEAGVTFSTNIIKLPKAEVKCGPSLADELLSTFGPAVLQSINPSQKVQTIVESIKRKRGRPPKDKTKLLAQLKAQQSPAKLPRLLPKGFTGGNFYPPNTAAASNGQFFQPTHSVTMANPADPFSALNGGMTPVHGQPFIGHQMLPQGGPISLNGFQMVNPGQMATPGQMAANFQQIQRLQQIQTHSNVIQNAQPFLNTIHGGLFQQNNSHPFTNNGQFHGPMLTPNGFSHQASLPGGDHCSNMVQPITIAPKTEKIEQN